LRVMSPTSYQAAPPRVRGCALYSDDFLMQPFFKEKVKLVCNLNDIAHSGYLMRKIGLRAWYHISFALAVCYLH
ncbi:hypothetical protein, partial [Lelliottia amnigena]